MDNPGFVQIVSAQLVEDMAGKLWLPATELQKETTTFDIVQIGTQYFDNLGYSIGRRAFWIREVQIEGAADNIELELEKHLAEQ